LFFSNGTCTATRRSNMRRDIKSEAQGDLSQEQEGVLKVGGCTS
jgi:hypothetical protein